MLKMTLCLVSLLAFSQSCVLAGTPATRPSDEFYIGGDVVRSGVWEITGTTEPVLKAIEHAQVKDSDADYQITIIHRVGTGKLERITMFNSLKALQQAPDEATGLVGSDVVQVKLVKA